MVESPCVRSSYCDFFPSFVLFMHFRSIQGECLLVSWCSLYGLKLLLVQTTIRAISIFECQTVRLWFRVIFFFFFHISVVVFQYNHTSQMKKKRGNLKFPAIAMLHKWELESFPSFTIYNFIPFHFYSFTTYITLPRPYISTNRPFSSRSSCHPLPLSLPFRSGWRGPWSLAWTSSTSVSESRPLANGSPSTSAPTRTRCTTRGCPGKARVTRWRRWENEGGST